jgi:hypothetical protein
MANLLVRRTAIAALITSVVTAAVVALGACNETRRSLGEECLKGDDCVSSLCSSQHCAEAPPLLESGVVPEAASDVAVTDTGTDAAAIDATDSASFDGDGADAADSADGD